MTQDEIIEMAKQAGFTCLLREEAMDMMGGVFEGDTNIYPHLEAFAKLVAAKAIAKDREEFDIDELCARQNKIGYRQGYQAGQLAEREACAMLCLWHNNTMSQNPTLFHMAELIRARGEA